MMTSLSVRLVMMANIEEINVTPEYQVNVDGHSNSQTNGSVQDARTTRTDGTKITL